MKIMSFINSQSPLMSALIIGFITLFPHFIPEGRGKRKEGRMKKRRKRSQAVGRRKRRNE